jgi:hypothetical protein
MYTVVRTYSGPGAKELFDIIEERQNDVEGVIRAVAGFVSWTLVRTSDGGFTVTVCQEKAGTDESSQVARDWVAENAPDIGANPPQVSEGSVAIHLS